jgi:hypothetical protein
MTQEERDRIINNEYADLLVEYSSNMRAFERYPEARFMLHGQRLPSMPMY